MTILVVNKNNGERGYYIGRPTTLGNPYVIGRHGNREKVVNLYRNYAIDKMKDEESPFFKEIMKLKEQEIRTGEVRLQCFCSPQACHGDIIKEILENM